MKLLIFGAGAIGTYIGGSLAANGNLVFFFDRKEMVSRIRQTGIKIHKADNTTISLDKPNISSDLADLLKAENFDCAIIAVKSFDTESLIHQVIEYQSQIPPIVCLQNGVENEITLKKLLPSVEIIAGSVTTAIGKTADHEIVVEKLRGIGIENKGSLSKRLVNEMNRSGLKAKLFNNANDMKWSKMVTNLTSNAMSAILGMTPAEILDNNQLYSLEIEQLREALRVMQAFHFNIVDLPGTPVRLFCWVVKYLPPSISKKILVPFIAKGRGAKMPSFYIDLESGRGKSEVEFLNGAVVRYGEKSKVSTPVNLFLTNTLIALTDGRIERSEYLHQHEKVIDHFVNYGLIKK
ncbi:MAG: ketopantoate reductase family protein [Anaerolineaceae bacterium]